MTAIPAFSPLARSFGTQSDGVGHKALAWAMNHASAGPSEVVYARPPEGPYTMTVSMRGSLVSHVPFEAAETEALDLGIDSILAAARYTGRELVPSAYDDARSAAALTASLRSDELVLQVVSDGTHGVYLLDDEFMREAGFSPRSSLT